MQTKGILLRKTNQVISIKTPVQDPLSCKYPIPFWPNAAPILPVPSTIPVTVDKALLLCFNASCLPKSAQAVPEIIFDIPPTKNPRINMSIYSNTFSLLVKNIKNTWPIVASSKPTNQIGVLFPYIQSERSPRRILPAIVPIS